MADLVGMSGTITAVTAAVVAVVGAIRQPADVSKLREEVNKARTEIEVAFKADLAALAARIDPKLREHLDALAQRVAALEERLDRYRREMAAGSSARPAQAAPLSSSPDLLARVDAEHERRIVALEQRAEKQDARTERQDSSIAQAREMLAKVLGAIEGPARR